MRSILASLRTLVLPFGATSGRRLILDGVNGAIEAYDAANRLRIKIGGSAPGEEDRITLSSGDADETSRAMIRTLAGNPPSLELASPEVINQSDRAWLSLSAPVNDPGLDRARVDIFSDLSPGVDLFLALARLLVDEGADKPMGVATLVAGTVTVTHALVGANTRIFLSRQATGGALGHLSCTRIAATSFTINSSSATDTSTIAYLLVEPF